MLIWLGVLERRYRILRSLEVEEIQRIANLRIQEVTDAVLVNLFSYQIGVQLNVLNHIASIFTVEVAYLQFAFLEEVKLLGKRKSIEFEYGVLRQFATAIFEESTEIRFLALLANLYAKRSALLQNILCSCHLVLDDK